jgi:hypothetical protein
MVTLAFFFPSTKSYGQIIALFLLPSDKTLVPSGFGIMVLYERRLHHLIFGSNLEKNNSPQWLGLETDKLVGAIL